jgi:hypothetical protein
MKNFKYENKICRKKRNPLLEEKKSWLKTGNKIAKDFKIFSFL